MSVLENVKTESAQSKSNFATREYLRAKVDFPINVQKQFVIIRGSASRLLYMGKNTGCRSFDGIIGKTVESGYKEERECETCDYKFGFTDEKGVEYKCKRQYTLYLEHPDPESEYVLTISYGAQKQLEKYAELLTKIGLDADKVITGITRIENPDGPGTTYKFEKIGELDLELNPSEDAALANLRAKALSTGNAIPVQFATDLLMNLASLSGITLERATRLAESIAENGMITGKSN